MRQLMLIIAVVCLGFFSTNTLAQAPGTNNASQTDTKGCPALVAQTLLADRFANARKCYQQGLELSENGQLVRAAEIFRQAVQFDPEYADAYAALGRTYFKLREWQQAIANLNRAASLKSKQRETNESALKNNPIVKTPPSPKASPANVPNNSSHANSTTKQAIAVELPKQAEKQNINGPTTPSIQPQPNPIQSGKSTDVPQLKAEAEIRTVAGPTPPVSKNSALQEQTPVGANVAMSAPPPPPKLKETAGPALSTIPRSEELPLTKIYRVGPNDVLDIRLNDSSQQSTLFTVTATGLLEHPLLTQPMSVTGLTIEEIGTRLDEDLRKRAIIENPKAVVGVRDYASHAVLVSGLVRDAGTKFLRREAIPLYVVVADAQPLPEAAKVSVVRNESNQIYEIDLNQAADMNFLVRPGDVITLSPNTTQFVYVGGEVKFPGEKTFRRGIDSDASNPVSRRSWSKGKICRNRA